MPAIPIPIANGFYESDSLPLSHQSCVNWYPNVPQGQALSMENLFGTPGINQLVTTGAIANANRGAHVKGGIAYFVNGTVLYRLDRTVNPDLSETWDYTSLGTVEGEGRVSMADNGTQLMILSPGGKGYIYNEAAGTPFQEITAPGFTANGNPQHVLFLDGYFICTTDSKKWIISSLNDGLAWNSLDFSSAESDPDVTVAPVKVSNQLLILGSISTETFRNVPNGDGFPFVRGNVFSDKGCSAAFSLIQAHGTVYMLGAGEDESPAYWRYTGSNWQKVSSTAIDSVLATMSDADMQQAFSFKYANKGAYFVGFTVDQYTFVFDTVNNRWHERRSLIDGEDLRWRVNSMITAYGRILVGDSIDGRIGELTKDVYTEYGNTIQRIISTQPFANMGKSLKVPMIEITVESGVGNADRLDPMISMDVSKDGKTWGYERKRSMGKVGEYNRRAIWYKNGRFPRFAVFRWKMSDPVKPVIVKAEMVAH